MKGAQKDKLVQMMEANFSILKGKYTGNAGAHLKQSVWNEVAEELNRMGPVIKTAAKWKTVSCYLL